jgi:outer membrane murein-binding lipoprotein Lpp
MDIRLNICKNTYVKGGYQMKKSISSLFVLLLVLGCFSAQLAYADQAVAPVKQDTQKIKADRKQLMQDRKQKRKDLRAAMKAKRDARRAKRKAKGTTQPAPVTPAQ